MQFFKKNKNLFNSINGFHCIVIFSLLLLFVNVYGVSYTLLTPGFTQNLIDKKIINSYFFNYNKDGKIQLVTVQATDGTTRLNLLHVADHLLHPGSSFLYPKYIIYPPKDNVEKVNKDELKKFDNSINNAFVAVSNNLNININHYIVFNGINKYDISDDIVHTKDHIVSINNKKINLNYNQFFDYLDNNFNNGDNIALKIKRNNRLINKNTYVVANDIYKNLTPGALILKVNNQEIHNSKSELNKALLSVGDNQLFTLRVNVNGNVKDIVLKKTVNLINLIKYNNGFVYNNSVFTINIDDIGGPSAGLAFALSLYNILGKLKLNGLNVVATGTINSKSNIGPIGGINLKFISAKKAHAQLFLIPRDNCSELPYQKYKNNSSIHIVPVDNLLDAINQVNQYNNNLTLNHC